MVRFFKIFPHFFSNLVVNKFWQHSKLLNLIYKINFFFCCIKVCFCVLFSDISLLKTQRYFVIHRKYPWFSDFFSKLTFRCFSWKMLVNNVILMKNEHFCWAWTAGKLDYGSPNLLKTSILILTTTNCCKCTALYCFFTNGVQCGRLSFFKKKA